MVKIEVHEGKFPLYVGIVIILLGVALFVLFVLDSDSPIDVMLMSLFLVECLFFVGGGTYMCMNARNRRLTVEDMTLCYTNWFGRKRTFSLDDIGYCKMALERGNRDFLKVYNLQNEKLCKLEFNMCGSADFLQYLIDNQVRLECSKKTDAYVKCMVNAAAICPEEISGAVNKAFEEMKAYISEWGKKNSRLKAEWKMGIVTYQEEKIVEGKQWWEQESDTETSLLNPPEGFFIVIEGYLQKDGQFVIDKKNQAVSFLIPVIKVSKSMQIGEDLRISHYRGTLEDLQWQLEFLAHFLPRNRYHTEMITVNHELKERLL